jgi:AraC-like DNA-binding protein
VEVFPTGRGAFRAELTQVCLDKLWMQHGHESLPQVSIGAIQPGRKIVGFLANADLPAMNHCGMEVAAGDLVVTNTGPMHHRTEMSCDWGSMSLTLDDFNAACMAIEGYEFAKMPQSPLVQPSPALMSRLLEAHREVMRIARTNSDLLGIRETAANLEQQLIHLMIRCLTEGGARKFTAGRRRRDGVIARFEEFLEANPSRALYLTEICSAIGVAERSLRVACEEHLGMGPIRYLTLRRMHLVRRALLRADPSQTSVTRIAMDHGFWELGHFSVFYRKMFGEVPSESLRRLSSEYRILPNRPTSLPNA